VRDRMDERKVKRYNVCMDERRVKRYNVWMQGICFCLIFSGIQIRPPSKNIYLIKFKLKGTFSRSKIKYANTFLILKIKNRNFL
jgi:hypothetical protein